MSWTSESEPQSHTTDEGDTSTPDTNGGSNGSSSAVDGAHSADADGAPVPDGSHAGRRNGDSDLNDDGDLDPSLFFGLFDDLLGDDDTDGIDDGAEQFDTRSGDDTGNADLAQGSDDTAEGIDTDEHATTGGTEVDAADNDALFGVLEQLLRSAPPDDGREAAVAGDGPFTVEGDDNDSDVVVLGGDLPPEGRAEADTGSGGASRSDLLDEAVVDEGVADGPEPESDADGVPESGTTGTVEPVVEAGIRQPEASTPEVLSPTVDSRPSTPAPVDDPRSPTRDLHGATGPSLGVVLAAVLVPLVVVLIAAVVVLGDGGGSQTDAEGDPAPADGAGAEPDQAADVVGDDAAQPAPETAAPGAATQDGGSVRNQASPVVAALAQELAEGRVDLTSIRFVPGTIEPTEAGARLIRELAEAVLLSGGQPVTVIVRTFSEAGPADNQTLSEAQAAALVELLAAEGVPADQLVAVGLGSGPLSPQQPVPDFVVVNPELGDAIFKQVIADIGAFSLGSNPESQLGEFESDLSSNPLRIESRAVVDGVGQALVNFEDSTIGLAGYSYFQPDNDSNRARAGEVSNIVARRLSEVHGIGPDRITIITPGSAPYVVTPEIGNHVWIRAGARTTTAFQVAGVDTSAIEFVPGSATPTPASTTVLDQLAAALTASTDTLVIDVRTYSEASGAANMEMSQDRADAIADYLVQTGGVEAGRLRAFGSGASSYFADDGGSGVTVTALP